MAESMPRGLETKKNQNALNGAPFFPNVCNMFHPGGHRNRNRAVLQDEANF